MRLMITTLLLCCSHFLAIGQEAEEEKLANRIFMPSIQMGYINNHSDLLSGGLFIQTSLEYQTPKGIFFRINYDDFDSNYKLDNPQSLTGIIEGKVSFSEFIGGLGYRYTKKKHNLLLAAQVGGRFYGQPVVNSQGNTINIAIENRHVMMSRYTLGYEYEIDTRAFLTLELFGSHAFEQKDFWENDAWATGFTIGITTTIF